MGNFSTYFPIPSSGGGGGGGINSYAPFKVTATGNPVGYDSTTGVYTNPIDSSVWLKTGETTSTPPSAYPNAFNNGVAGQSSVSINLNAEPFGTGNVSTQLMSITQARPYSSTADLWVAGRNGYGSYVGSDVFKFTWSGTRYDFTGVHWAAGTGGGYRGIAHDGTNLWVSTAVNDSDEIIQYSEAGVATGNTINYSSDIPANHGSGTAASIAYDGTHLYILHTVLSPSIATPSYIMKYLPNGTFVSAFALPHYNFVYLSVTLTGAGGLLLGFSGSTSLVQINKTTGATETPIFATLIARQGFLYIPNQTGDAIKFITINGASAVTRTKWDTDNYIFGDTTARTSAMGDGQPLFIKLK